MSKLEKPTISGWFGCGSSSKKAGAAIIVERVTDGQSHHALQLGPSAGILRTVNLTAAQGGKMVVIRYRVTDTAANDWFGLFVRDGEGTNEAYRLQSNPGINGGKGVLILRKKNTPLLSRTVSLTGTHELELRITYTQSKNTLAVLVDGKLIGSAEDTGQDSSAVLLPTAHTSIAFSNFNNEPTAKTIVDDISVKIRTVSTSGEEKGPPAS